MIDKIELIHEIINKHDPMGLLAGGAPTDEYDWEALQIARILRDAPGDLEKSIYQMFVDRFNEETAGDKNKYKALADDIIKIDIVD
ncbi:hypothetical protein CO086_00725 [Candidatus Uhrbacteria bacterium CG_4_9_14_0_8_um_filter_41_16]|nr:MAG: hypothetical protein CO086_00725 [Candidatus Uhrbacteria bacterium CG_4_9_14_0_8_um_filter_41_16]